MNFPGAVPADFLSLLEENKLSLRPSLTNGSSSPVQTQATTVFAFHFAEGVLVAGDRRATAGNIIVTDKVEKVIEIDSTSLLAIAGVPATAFEMARVLQTSFEYYRRSQLQNLSLPAKVRSLARLLRENLPMTMQGIGVVVPLFITWDHATNLPQIFFYDPLGAQIPGSRQCHFWFRIADYTQYSQLPGKGNPVPSKMSLPEATQFALRLLMVASEFDSATGGVNPETHLFATIKTLTKRGVETMSDEQQRQYLQPKEVA